MVKGSKSGSHQLFKDKAKNKVDDLQGMFTDLQLARKESRANDVAVLEEQVHQMLREWKAELNEASPASSLLEVSHASRDLSSDIRRLLQLCEEEDDATSVLAPSAAVAPLLPKLKLEEQTLQPDDHVFQEDFYANRHERGGFQEGDRCKEMHSDELINTIGGGFQEGGRCKEIHSDELNYTIGNCGFEAANQLDLYRFDLQQGFSHNLCTDFGIGGGQHGDSGLPDLSGLLPRVCPPPAAFLRPKCALWDCPRPSQGSGWCQDYCSSFHGTLAMNESSHGMTPVLRPWGIDLKDGPLFAALSAKTQGKDVGIPECEGAATTKSPWNAPELFDLSVLEGETIREWLFFDKPRRAFESGNRKQRSLPDYNGRGWHESRKQVMKDFCGLKRSYYMDPQPLNHFEWHLYEYEMNNCDACALYRLELKLVEGKKNPRGKINVDSVVDLQHQMGRLTAEFPEDNKRSVKGRTKVIQKTSPGNEYSPSAPNRVAASNDNFGYGQSVQYGYFVENLNDYYGT